jgi:hypothetical protein
MAAFHFLSFAWLVCLLMDSPRSSFLLIAFFAFLIPVCVPCSAQNVKTPRKGSIASNLVRPEYYAAIDFYEDAQTLQAFEGFERALVESRQVNGERGIDSVPPLVMMGECLLTQGDIGAALDKYEAALAISIQCSGWISLINNPVPNDRVESKGKDVTWGATNSRNATNLSYSDPWLIALGSSDLLLERQSGKGVAGRLVPMDATEILRCQAIALRRRLQLLGGLVQHNPVTPLLAQVFVVPNAPQMHEPLRVGIAICAALANSPSNNRSTTAIALKKNLTLSSGHDHALTSIALLSLADIAIDSNEMLSAEEFAIEASLSAAKAEQAVHVDEALELWSMCSYQNQKEGSAIGKTLQQTAKWSSVRSRLVTIRSQVEVVRQAALRGDADVVRKQASNATAMLLPKQISLPKMVAVVAYAQSRIAFLEGNDSQGLQKLEESLVDLRGTTPLNTGSRLLYQLNLASSLVEGKQLTEEIGKRVLGDLLQQERPGLWRTQVLEQLAFQTTDKSEAWRMYLRSVQSSKDLDEQLLAWDAWAGYRFRRSSLLGGRLFELRRAIHTDTTNLSPREAKETESLRRILPKLSQNASLMREWTEPFERAPQWDTRRWNEEENKRWDALLRLSTTQESLLWAASASPLAIPASFPSRLDLPTLRKSMQSNDAVVMFGVLDQSVVGFIVTPKGTQSWRVAEESGWFNGLNAMLAAIGTGGNVDQPNLKKLLIGLRSVLLPDEIWSVLQRHERWIIVPDESLWQLPMELMPIDATRSYVPAISNHAICYSPTLGCIPQLIQPGTVTASSPLVLHSADFWGKERASTSSLMERAVSLIPKSQAVDIASSQSLPPARYAKLATDRVVSLTINPWNDPNTFVTGIDRTPGFATLAGWNQLPWGMPREQWFFGAQCVFDPSTTTGDEWLRLSLAMIGQGTRHIVVSRWHVGGESTCTLLQSLQDGLEGTTFSRAWQRAVANLSIEEFDVSTEPSLQGFQMLAERVSGSLPKFWAGTMSIGDPEH